MSQDQAQDLYKKIDHLSYLRVYQAFLHNEHQHQEYLMDLNLDFQELQQHFECIFRPGIDHSKSINLRVILYQDK